ncbi:hypothetical protein BDV95DRAFT_557317 [Massariosphaeria phaeospora]|uniref:Uncharacterized protein n=1 Tax=Massariosphaeria phaeospora TaxID=100035 RepID=A0A7C8IJZ0_9PLEO|nr:hypothetical protein BDV95DRAFT_557317 [Massariosphaeria phaeospora]
MEVNSCGQCVPPYLIRAILADSSHRRWWHHNAMAIAMAYACTLAPGWQRFSSFS